MINITGLLYLYINRNGDFTQIPLDENHLRVNTLTLLDPVSKNSHLKHPMEDIR